MKTLTEVSDELRKQRKSLSMNQKDMLMKIGMSQQQYQRIEAGGDLRVSTLMRILEGMGLELVLAQSDRVGKMERVLEVSDKWNDNQRRDEYNGGLADRKSWDSLLDDLEDESS